MIAKDIKRIGSLRDMNQAVRLIERLGSCVVSVDGYEITTADHEVITFTELPNGRIVVK